MISKLSSHLGPTSLFSGISAGPSLVLYMIEYLVIQRLNLTLTTLEEDWDCNLIYNL
jgi:hypothetical protein